MRFHRDRTIDILKGIAIICIVLGHSGAPITHFVYLFHVAVFIIAAGYCYDEKHSVSGLAVFSNIKRKIKSLWLPFFCYNAVLVLLFNLFLKIGLYTDDVKIYDCQYDFYIKGAECFCNTADRLTIAEAMTRIARGTLFWGGGGDFGGTMWFLKTLFVISVAYCVIEYMVRKYKVHWLNNSIIAVLLLGFGYYCSLKRIQLMGLATIASTYWMYHAGRHLRKALCSQKITDYKSNPLKLTGGKRYMIIISVLATAILGVCNIYGGVSLVDNSYVNPIFLILVSLCGWFLLYTISSFVNSTVFGMLLGYIGQHSLIIMLMHFLCMKAVQAMVVFVYNLPHYYLAVFPHLYGNRGGWWVLYSATGVGLPLLIRQFYLRENNL